MQPRSRRNNFTGALTTVLLPVLVLIALTGKGAGQQCPGQSSCILPQPAPPPFAVGESDLRVALFSLRCTLACVEQYAPDTELINTDSPWPTYTFDFSDNCGLYNKIHGCKQGCMEYFANPGTTVNRCRDGCYSQCMDSNQVQHSGNECPLDCRKTYCRFGCSLYESIISDNATSLPLAPSAGPEVVPIQTSNTCARWLHEVTISSPSQNESSSSVHHQYPVGFLLKVSSHDGNIVRYVWQQGLNVSLDFASLACQQISLSIAVVSESTSLSSLVFSPESSVCIPGLDAYPSQVVQSGIQVHFSEDFRQDFFGYSVANLSWQRPQGYACVTSYQVNVYPDRVQCGGIDAKEQPGIQFININKTFTSFLFRAKEADGFMKFGCSYIFEIETLPVPEIQVGPRITRSTELTEVPTMEVECERVWETDGSFSVSVAVTLQASGPTTHISRLSLSPTVQRNGEPIQILAQETLIPQGNSMKFVKVLSEQFSPQNDSTQTLKVQIRATRNPAYYWRRIPQEKSCFVQLDPISPLPVQNILVENVHYVSPSSQLLFDLSWTPPPAYGQLMEYDLVVLSQEDRDMLLSGSNVDVLNPYYQNALTPELTEISVNTTVDVNSSVHCLYLQMRAKNNYTMFSTWSSAVVLPLDEHCITQPPSVPTNLSIPVEDNSQDQSRISVFYVANDGSRINLLDVGCDDTAGASEQSLHNRLEGIESRVDAVLSQLNAENEAFARLSHLQAKLTDIEHKLDALMNMVTTHVYN